MGNYLQMVVIVLMVPYRFFKVFISCGNTVKNTGFVFNETVRFSVL